jgi:inositol polyphosphate-4-phosphatase
MCAHNDTLKRSGVLDIVSVGCFTRHTGKTKTGGLIKLLHQIKDSPNRIDQIGHKVAAANDVVQSIKQLRKEIVEIMSQLLLLAKTKNPKGMLPLCNEMMGKTRALLNIWEPSLVEEAFQFIERHRIIDEPDNSNPQQLQLSPFKKITQQLGALDLKSPELEDFATPMEPQPDLWPPNQQKHLKLKSPSTTDLQAISSVQDSVKSFNSSSEKLSQSLPPISLEAALNPGLRFSETHFDVSGEVLETPKGSLTSEQLIEQKNDLLSAVYDENGYLIENTAIVLNHTGAFLDTKAISSSDFYRPSEEPEPLDLTQLNVEASVMCLVSKVKFLCGRCGSPAVRLRQPRNSMGSVKRFNSMPPDVVTSQPHSHSAQEAGLAKPSLNGKDLNLALTEAVGEVTRKVKGNKFTDGLDLSMTTGKFQFS